MEAKELKEYIVPYEGSVQIFAKSEEEAEEIFDKMLADEILDQLICCGIKEN